MSEAEEIFELINKYAMCRIMLYNDWSTENMHNVDAKKNAIECAIQSIIAERDQLRKAAQSHRGKA